jgi:hypothetical protein
MPQISLEVPHALSQDEATRRLKQRCDLVGAMYGSHVSELRQEWDGHTLSFGFHAMGMKIAGTVAVELEKVKLAANLPLAAVFLKGTIESRIREEVGGLLA